MGSKGIIIKGNKDGLKVEIDLSKFESFDDMLGLLIEKLSKGKQFYKNSTVFIITTLSDLTEKDVEKLKEILLEEIEVKEIVFEDVNEEESTKQLKDGKGFSGIHEGKTKFIRKAIRGGQIVNYSGNIVIIGDVNSGAEVYASGNIIVLGTVKGNVYAGTSGNRNAVIAAFSLQPKILKIGDIITITPPDAEKPLFPEVAKIKENAIIVELYLNNKYMY